MAMVALPAGWGALGSGCSTPPPIGAYPLKGEPGETVPRARLTPEQEAEALAAMRSTRPDDHVTIRPSTAPQGRWTDVRTAMAVACDRDGIDAAVVGVQVEDDGDTLRFEVLTAEEWRGEIVVRRAEPVDWERLRAESTLGLVQRRSHRERLAALLEAFEVELLAYGRKPRWDEGG